MENDRRPVVALVSTPKYREMKKDELRRFAYGHLFTLSSHFDVISTGNTYQEICEFMKDRSEIHAPDNLRLIANDMSLLANDLGDEAASLSLETWRDSILSHFEAKGSGVRGMIDIASELVQGKIDAVIQFSVGDDTTVRAGSAVLRREANVHDVPIASDEATAHAFVQFWKDKLKAGNSPSSLFRPRKQKVSPCADLNPNSGDRILALIAHDGRKVEMCRFVMEHSEKLNTHFSHILATGHSGELVKDCLRVRGWTDDELDRRILKCSPGPEGGDVEIAMAVIQGLCDNVFFFQDPATSHPHEADIRLFEQAILDGTRVRLASNSQSARILLETIVLTGTPE